MDQLLNDFSLGLFLVQAFILLVLIFALRKFAWRPILDALQIREDSIQEALDAAEIAKKDIEKLQSKNEKLLDEARLERDDILKEAREASNQMKEEAKEEVSKISDKMLEDARNAINTEKQAALTELKNQVATLSLEIAEKLLRAKLKDEKAQKALVDDFVKELNLN
ncbi:MAG: F0F1 ATP synthase subunit B [Cyclobacteriaceae bacterium]|nr:F0F1 ATP synthase subunit B [Cyclobacteriaceae bacterium]